MKFLIELILILIVFASIMFGQNKLPKLDSSFVSSKLIKGVPISLEENDYFSQLKKISYAVIYKDQNDSIYFISEKSKTDSSNYLLVSISNGIVTDYNFLNFEKAGNNTLFAEGKLNPLNRGVLSVELYYNQRDNVILYKFINKRSAKLEIGIRDELVFLIANKDQSTRNIIGESFLLNLHLTAGVHFLRYYKVSIRFGITAAGEYILGFDEGMFFQASLSNTNIYFNTGVDLLNNNLASDGMTEPQGKFTFYCLGLGYKSSKNFDIDIMYYTPSGNKVYATNPEEGELKINGLIKLGFQYSFIF